MLVWAGQYGRAISLIFLESVLSKDDIFPHWTDVSVVKVKVETSKGGILENVYIKETEKAYFEMHIDTDDANAFLLNQNDEVEIIL